MIHYSHAESWFPIAYWPRYPLPILPRCFFSHTFCLLSRFISKLHTFSSFYQLHPSLSSQMLKILFSLCCPWAWKKVSTKLPESYPSNSSLKHRNLKTGHWHDENPNSHSDQYYFASSQSLWHGTVFLGLRRMAKGRESFQVGTSQALQ